MSRAHMEPPQSELQECLQIVLHHAEMSLVLLDSDGVICLWNSASERLFGYGMMEMVGRADTFLIPGDRLEEMRRQREEALEGTVVEDLVTERLDRSGQRVAVRLTLCPVRDAAGRVVALVELSHPLNGTPPPSRLDQATWDEADQALEALLATLPPEGHAEAELVGNSPAFQEVRRQISRLGPTEATLLILGESGTGKELVARALHKASARHDKPFVAINCAALPRELLESELFGHERGAFTGAVRRKLGQLEIASGGTVLLDEICELPLDLQPKLLRMLEERSFTRIGGVQEVEINVRFLAATNRPIRDHVRNATFREDLYYRLSATRIVLPPLRDRSGDLPVLAQMLLQRIAHLHSREPKPLEPEAVSLLMRHHWPGNVRELRNVLEQGFLLSDGDTVAAADLAPLLEGLHEPDDLHSGFPVDASLEQIEASHIRRVLEAVRWNKTQAAHTLGIGRDTLYRKMRRYGLS